MPEQHPDIVESSKTYTMSAISENEARLNGSGIFQVPQSHDWVATLSAKVIPPTTNKNGFMISECAKILEVYHDRMFVLAHIPVGIRGSDIRVDAEVVEDITLHRTIMLDIQWSYTRDPADL